MGVRVSGKAPEDAWVVWKVRADEVVEVFLITDTFSAGAFGEPGAGTELVVETPGEGSAD